MLKHSHVYYHLSTNEKGPLQWDAHHSGHPRSVSDNESEQDDALAEIPVFQPVYVIPHAAVQEISQWTQSNKIMFENADGTK